MSDVTYKKNKKRNKMKKQFLILLTAATMFASCEKNEDAEVMLMTQTVPEVTGMIEIQFLGWESTSIGFRVGSYGIVSNVEMTIRFYGDGEQPTEKELNAEILILPLDSLNASTINFCNNKEWGAATYDLERKEGWYMLSTMFLFQTGSFTSEYNDTLHVCNDLSRDKIFIGTEESCYSSDTDFETWRNQ